jgi:hypothetical protein
MPTVFERFKRPTIEISNLNISGIGGKVFGYLLHYDVQKVSGLARVQIHKPFGSDHLKTRHKFVHFFWYLCTQYYSEHPIPFH